MPAARSASRQRRYANEDDLFMPLTPDDYRIARVEQIKAWLIIGFSTRRIILSAHSNTQPEWEVTDDEVMACIEQARAENEEVLNMNMRQRKALVLNRFESAFSQAMALGDPRGAVEANERYARYAGLSDKPDEAPPDRPFADSSDAELIELARQLLAETGIGGDLAGTELPFQLGDGNPEVLPADRDQAGQLAERISASGGSETFAFSFEAERKKLSLRLPDPVPYPGRQDEV